MILDIGLILGQYVHILQNRNIKRHHKIQKKTWCTQWQWIQRESKKKKQQSTTKLFREISEMIPNLSTNSSRKGEKRGRRNDVVKDAEQTVDRCRRNKRRRRRRRHLPQETGAQLDRRCNKCNFASSPITHHRRSQIRARCECILDAGAVDVAAASVHWPLVSWKPRCSQRASD